MTVFQLFAPQVLAKLLYSFISEPNNLSFTPTIKYKEIRLFFKSQIVMKCQCNAPLKTQIFRKSSLKLPVCPVHYSDIQTSVSNRTARKALLEPFKEQTILI